MCDDVIYLISTTYAPDDLGNQVATTTRTKRYCRVDSVTRSEFYAAGNAGLHPAYKFIFSRHEYNNEKLVEYGGVIYQIYRTYRKDDEQLELYAAERVGV